MPTTEIEFEGNEISIIDILVECKLCASCGKAKKLIQQGGVSVEEEKVSALDYNLTKSVLANGVKIKKGKKIYHKVILK